MSLLQKRLEERRQEQQGQNPGTGAGTGVNSPVKRLQWRQINEAVTKKVAESFDTEAMEQMPAGEKDKYISQRVRELLDEVQAEIGITLGRGEYHRMSAEVVSEITGFGPITSLLADKSISEIMVNGPEMVYVERNGKIELTDITFRDNNHVLHIIERIVAPIGRRIDESSPMVDGRLPDGSRVNAVIPPVLLNGPTLTIRKFASTPYIVSDLIKMGTMTNNMALFIKACVEGRLNIIVAGGTGSGKTTTLNVLSSFIPDSDRIVTIEDAAELQLQQPHVLRMEARPPNIEGRGEITIRHLVRNSLRMRPDRIVVGEVRGGEALDMLQAMNTGHDGCLSTIHANSPRDTLSRLETMVLMSGMDLPLKAIREQALSAVDLIVFQTRFKDGTRKITNITEVVGMEGNTITLQDIFCFEQQGVAEGGRVIGSFKACGVMPKFFTELDVKGVHVPAGIFA